VPVPDRIARHRIARRLVRLSLCLTLALPAIGLVLPQAALAAAPITGTVTNRTNGKPAAGDTVVLIRLAQGMQEATHTTTDAHGHFTLDVPDEGLHLVRVTHDKANYFQPAPQGTTHVDVDVYSVAANVKGVSTEAMVLRLQTDPSGTSINVVENFFIKNDSAPPTTQFSNEPFDFYLPAGAIVEGSAALAPGGMPLKVAPVPLGDHNKYTFLFPIRPGETRFQVSYHIPYSGTITIDPQVTGPTGTVAVMLPKSMSITPAAGSPLGAVNDEVDAQTYVAQNVKVGQPISFTLSGKGQLPRDTQNPNDQGGAQAQGDQSGNPQATNGTIPATDNTAPGKGLDNPLDPNGNREPLSKYKWWILAGLAFLLAIAAGILLRKPVQPTGTPLPAPPTPPRAPRDQNALLLEALKEELFALETDRLQARISDYEYSEQKAAIELVLRRALARSTPQPADTRA
jgi:hypothetical protein